MAETHPSLGRCLRFHLLVLHHRTSRLRLGIVVGVKSHLRAEIEHLNLKVVRLRRSHATGNTHSREEGPTSRGKAKSLLGGEY